MMIKLNDKWAIVVDTAKLNYTPMLWYEEREVKSVITGKVTIKPAGYYSIERYYPNFHQAIRGIAHYEITELMTEPSDFGEFAQKVESMIDNLYNDCVKHLKRK